MEDCKSTYDEVKSRGNYHMAIAHSNARFYRKMSLVLALAIPIISALVAFFTSFGEPHWIRVYALPSMALSVTIFSILNSVLNPSARFINGAHLAAEIYDWDMDLEVNLKKIDPDNKEEILNFLQKKNRQMTAIGKALANTTNFKVESKG